MAEQAKRARLWSSGPLKWGKNSLPGETKPFPQIYPEIEEPLAWPESQPVPLPPYPGGPSTPPQKPGPQRQEDLLLGPEGREEPRQGEWMGL